MLTPYERYITYLKEYAQKKGIPDNKHVISEEAFNRSPELLEKWQEKEHDGR